jgi:hypothetical protein
MLGAKIINTVVGSYRVRQRVSFGRSVKLKSTFRLAGSLLFALGLSALLWWGFYALGDIFL